MNALEQMAKAMLEKAISNLPPEILENVGQIAGIVKGVKAQLDRIENQQRLIMAHLNIPGDLEITTEVPNGQQNAAD